MLGEYDFLDTLMIIEVEEDELFELREEVRDIERLSVGFSGDAVEVGEGVLRVALADRHAPDTLFVPDALRVLLGNSAD